MSWHQKVNQILAGSISVINALTGILIPVVMGLIGSAMADNEILGFFGGLIAGAPVAIVSCGVLSIFLTSRRSLLRVVAVSGLSLLLLAVPLSAQKNADKDARKAERDAQKAEQRAEQMAERRTEIRMELQTATDKLALGKLPSINRDPLIGGYISSLGQSLVPDDVPDGLKFSFRIINMPEPNAFALVDGRIYVTSGMIAFAENEAQLAGVLGHEIAHVTKQHLVNRIYASRYGKLATAGRIAGIFGAVTGNQAAGDIFASLGGLMSLKLGRDQEKEADLVGLRMALNRGFDPSSGPELFTKMHKRYGSPSRVMGLLSHHPPANRRAEWLRQTISEPEFQQAFAAKQGSLRTGSESYDLLTSVLRRDAFIQLAEWSDRWDLALEGLNAIRDVRPNDPKLLWALGRIHVVLGRGSDDRALGFLRLAADADRRGLYPAIHRDLGYRYATAAGDMDAAADSLIAYVTGYIAKHGSYPPDLEDVYDHLDLFGRTDWVAPDASRGETPRLSLATYYPPAWDTPAGATDKEDTSGYLVQAMENLQEAMQPPMSGSNK